MGSSATSVQHYTDLKVWHASMELADLVYDVSTDFPKHELFGLTSQVRRAAVSIPSNIAEGWGRGKTGEYVQFLRYARGSLYEVETQLRIAVRRGYVEREVVDRLIASSTEISKMLTGLTKALQRA